MDSRTVGVNPVVRQFLWSGFRSPTIASESTIRELIGSVNTGAFSVLTQRTNR